MSSSLSSVIPKKVPMAGNHFHHHGGSVAGNFFYRKLLSFSLYFLLLLALLSYYLSSPLLPSSPSTLPSSAASDRHDLENPTADPQQEPALRRSPARCSSYSEGEWVQDTLGPLYNGTGCETIKDGQNCMAHGRPDTGYLYWRWLPTRCSGDDGGFPRFDPEAFLSAVRHKHVAFVGDSVARNQGESLLCLLAAAYKPELLRRDGGGEDSKFRSYRFHRHNVTVSLFWSPFLVRVVEKNSTARHNHVFLDAVDERWASRLYEFDVVVFAIGHWFLIPGIYHDGGQVVGCHDCPELNLTAVRLFDMFQQALRRALAEVEIHCRSRGESPLLVAVTTFTRSHFEGDWDKAGSCRKTRPYRNDELEAVYTEDEFRRIAFDEVAAATATAKTTAGRPCARYETLDVTRMAAMRPDGHPGPYMYRDPFAGGEKERVQNDCVHWCLPGPVDTFNEVLMMTIMSS